MKTYLLFTSTVTAVLIGGATPLALAAERIDLYGTTATQAAAERTIVVNPATKYVNVTGGEIVHFVVGDKNFTWHFNGAGSITSFDLNKVAPNVFGRPFMAYVAPDPRYTSEG